MQLRVHRLLALLVVGCIALTTRPSRAQSRCDAVEGMATLDASEKDFVRGLCDMSDADAKLWRDAHSDQAEGKRLDRLARRTTETSRSDAAVLAAILPKGALETMEATITCAPETYTDAFEMALRSALGKERKERSDDRVVGTLSLHWKCANVARKVATPANNANNTNNAKAQAAPAKAKGSNPNEDKNGKDGGKADGKGELSYASATRPWTVLAPPGAEVRLSVGGPLGGIWNVEKAETKCDPNDKNTKGDPRCDKDGKFDPERSRLVPYTAMVPLGAPYVAVVSPEPLAEEKIVEAILSGDEEEAPLPLVLQGILSDEYTALGVPQAASCVDIRVAAEEDLRFFLDGHELELARKDGTFGRTLWIPRDARDETTTHRLAIVGQKNGEPRVLLAEQEIAARPAKKSCDGRKHDENCDDAASSEPATCTEAHFDLTRSVFNDTIGLLNVDAGRCADAGIDEHKVRAAAEAFLARAGWKLADVKGWAEDNEALASLGDSSSHLRHSAGRARDFREGYGAKRGRLDVVELLASGGEELRRQGFGRVLDLALHCSRRQESWDYSFEARVIDVKALVEAPRDPLRGVSMDGIVRDEIELILDRRELLIGIETTLAKAFRTESLGLRVMPDHSDYVEQLGSDVVVHLGGTPSGHHYVQLGYTPISESQAVTTCAKVGQIHELRAKNGSAALLPDAHWVSGVPVAVSPSAVDQTIHITVQQQKPTQVLVRAQLLHSKTPLADGRKPDLSGTTVVASSFRCTDLRRAPTEMWGTVGGWFSMGSDPSRNESSRSIVGMLGFDFLNDMPLVSMGLGLGYAYTYREGGLLPIWDGVDSTDPELFDQLGLTEYNIVEHAVLAVLNFRFMGSFCQATAGKVCGAVGRRALLEANVQVLPGVHIIDTTGIPADLSEFRGTTTHYALGDVGLFLGVGLGADAGPIRVSFRYAVGMRRLGDLARSPDDPGTNPALLNALTLGGTWEF